MIRTSFGGTALTIAASLVTAAFTVSGSGAAAQETVQVAAQASAPVAPAVEQDAAPARPATLADMVATQAQPDSLSHDMRCLAGAIYFEAKSESLDGQLAVGRVIVNRSHSGRFPASYCGVVFQQSQFSFVRRHAMPAIHEDSAGWRRAVAIAQIADSGSWPAASEGALYFHAARVSPSWRMTRIARVDDHVFYR
jgi:N-acetylmuramoyl-L-alanine amidase